MTEATAHRIKQKRSSLWQQNKTTFICNTSWPLRRGKNADRKAFLCKAAPGALIVAGCMLAWGGVFLHTAMMRADTRDLRAWCADEQNLTPYQQSLQDQQAADAYHSLTDYANSVTSLLASYPDLTSSLLNRIDAAGSGSGITVEFTSYDAASGVLQFNATSNTVIDIPAYVRALQNCGVFRTWTTPATNPPTPGPARRVRAATALHLGRTGITL